MSMKGIDAQVMAHRTTDYVKDASAQLRRNEMNQDFLAQQSKALSQEAQGQVAHLEQKEGPRVQVGEREQPPTPRKKKRSIKKEDGKLVAQSDEDDFEPDNPIVGAGIPNRIDIEV